MSVTYKMQDKPIIVDLPELSPGSDWGTTIYMLDANGDAINIDGWEMELIARDGVNGKTYLDLSVGDGITRNLSDGAFAVLASPAYTTGVDVSRLTYSIRITDKNGLIETFYKGIIPVSQEA